jgi:hypothetical protein
LDSGDYFYRKWLSDHRNSTKPYTWKGSSFLVFWATDRSAISEELNLCRFVQRSVFWSETDRPIEVRAWSKPWLSTSSKTTILLDDYWFKVIRLRPTSAGCVRTCFPPSWRRCFGRIRQSMPREASKLFWNGSSDLPLRYDDQSGYDSATYANSELR